MIFFITIGKERFMIFNAISYNLKGSLMLMLCFFSLLKKIDKNLKNCM